MYRGGGRIQREFCEWETLAFGKRFNQGWGLRGPAAMLFISRDTCSDASATLFHDCFHGVSHNYRAICCKWGVAEMCLCETKYQRGVSHHFGGLLTSLRRYRAIWGCRSDSIARSIARCGATKVWCVLGFGTGFEIALEPSKLQKENTLEKGTFIGSAKTDPVGFKRGFEEGLLKERLVFLK